MKRKGLLVIFCILGMLPFLYGQTLNYPPSCVVTMPHSNAYFKAGTDVGIHVYSTDIGKSANNGTVSKVEFFNGTTLLGEATTHTNYTYKFVWTCVQAGTYTIKARATNNNGITFTSVGVVITVGTNSVTQRGMSACKGKYLANIIPGAPQINYNTHWNGVTAENSCKWGPVESSRDNFNWSGADVTYNHAKNNNMMFRYHALIWASQFPSWFTSLSPEDARAEALEYMTAVAQRYPLSDQVDVINEQLAGHQPDNPTFARLLGGAGSTGYDWQIWVFTQARALFPNTKLVLNDYGLENDQNAIRSMLGLVKALRDRGLIDGFGTQAHCFNVDQTSGTQLKSSVDLMATSGLPVYVTELDLNGGVESENNASQQLSSFETHFPVYWDHPAVPGITIWGYITGATWKTGTGLMSSSGTEKSAFTWLKNYLTGKPSIGYPACATTGCTSNGASPVISLTAPANNASYAIGANISLTANATDSDGSVTRVEFFNGTTKLGEDLTSPYSYAWNTVAEGSYTITAVATDNSDNKTTSTAITIVVGNPRIPLIPNGEFDQGTTGWDIQNNSGATGTINVVTNGNLSGTNSLRICPTTPGTANWHVQVRHTVPLITGKNYRISVIAKADAARTMTVSLQQDADPYTTYFEEQADLSTSNQTFTFEYNSTVTDANAKLKFYVGGNATCVLIDKVELSEGNFQVSSTISPAGLTTFCSGGSVLLNANTGTGYTYQWKRDGTNINAATSSSYTATQSGSYTVVVTASSQSATSTAVLVTANASPGEPTVTSPVSYCQNATATTLTATGTLLKWYTASSGGTALASAPTPSTSSSGTTNYYVSQTTNECESDRALIAVTVNALPSAPTVTSPVIYCQNASSAVLTANGTSLKWYTASSGGIASATAPTPSTTTIGNINYYVSQTTNGCEGSRATIEVTVNAIPEATIIASGPTTFVAGGRVELQANTGLGLSYQWYKGNNPVGTGVSYTATESGSYSVEVSNVFQCSASSNAISVNVNTNQPSVITLTSPVPNSTIVGSITITVNVSDPDGGITLVEFLDGTNVIGTSTSSPYNFVWDNPGTGDHSISVRVTDSNGGVTTSSSTSITSGVTGIWSSVNSINADVYPNPANGEVFIDSDMNLSNASITLVDVLGKETVQSSVATGNGLKVDVSRLHEGIYILIIKQGNSILQKKITVKR